MVRQSSVFTMPQSSLSVGGQAWREMSITPYAISTGKTMWVGLYRHPSYAHVYGINTSGSSYRKTNTSWDSVSSMSGYSTYASHTALVRATYILKPNDPTSASVTRYSNTRQDLDWTRNSTSERPYTKQKIERWNNVTSSWSQINGNVSGSATSYSDSTTQENRQYKYRIRAWNDAGYSGYEETGYIKTAPAAPSNVVAVRSGSSVIVTWTNNSTAIATNMKIEKAEGPAYDTWVEVDYSLSGTATSKTDNSPYALGKYRVWSYVSQNTLNSSYVYSNEILTLSPPDAPTNLSPSSLEAKDREETITMSWQHNSVDTSEQTKFTLEYDTVITFDDDPQLVSDISTSNEYYVFDAEEFDTNTTYYWRVRTWGAASTGGTFSNGSSDWSAAASFKANTRPAMAITAPENESTLTTAELNVTWDFSDIDSDTQSQYRVGLYDETGTVQLDEISGYGTTDEIDFSYILSNETSYMLKGQVADSNGLWSDEVTAEFDTDFLEPVKPVLTLSKSDENIGVDLSVVNGDPVTTIVLESTQDSYVDADNGDTNYDDTSELKLYDNSGSNQKQILLDFDLSSIVGKTITSATLSLQRKTALSGTIDSLVKYIKTSWSEDTITYNTLPTLDTTEYGDHEHVSGASETWDLTTLISLVADGTITDFEGLIIIPDGADTYDDFYDSNYEAVPVLSIGVEAENAVTSTNQLYRSIDGETYEQVTEDELPPNFSMIDYLPLLVGYTYYYVIALSSTGTSNQSDIESVECDFDGYVLLNSGESDSDFIILDSDLSINQGDEYERDLISFDGRENPVLFEGDAQENEIKFSCTLPIASYDDMKTVMSNTGGGFYRDYLGRWFKCSFSKPDYKIKDKKSYAFSCLVSKVV